MDYLGGDPLVQIASSAACQIQQRVRAIREPALFVRWLSVLSEADCLQEAGCADGTSRSSAA